MQKELQRRNWLKDVRAKKGLTVREVAKLLEISFSHYSDIENGRKNPSVQVAMKIAKFYRFKPMKFYEDRVNLTEKNKRQKENDSKRLAEIQRKSKGNRGK